MRYLVQGMETESYINALVAITGITSEAGIDSLHDYYVKGHSFTHSHTVNGYPESNFTRTVETVNRAAECVIAYQASGDPVKLLPLCSFTSDTIVAALTEYYRTGVKPKGVRNLNRAIKRVERIIERIV
jgi:hypothetical protein